MNINPKKRQLSEDEILKRKADALLDKPIIITVDADASRYERLLIRFNLKRPSVYEFHVTGATLATMLKISRLLLDINYTEDPGEGNGQLDWAYKGIIDNLELSVKIIAIAIHNQDSEPPVFLEKLLLKNFQAIGHRNMVFNIINKLDVMTFMNTITSIRTMNILKEVSLKPVELIAPEQTISGEGLEMLSNIFASAIPK